MRCIVCTFILALALQAFGPAAQAQHEQHAAANPAMLLPEMGSLRHPVSTDNPEAQRFFDQGLLLVFAFNHEEAVRSFERAAELDPQLAMAYWGKALALGPNINLDVDPEREQAAYDAAQQALSLAGRASERERAYVEALSRRYASDPGADLRQHAVAYAEAMKALVQRFPDDLDAATLYAESLMDLRPWQLWNQDGTPAAGTEEIVAVLESVLRRDPDHVGANHYYIHAVEASPHPERALASAERIGRLAPGAGHLVHMPAHVYIRTGDYAGAARVNERAAAADRAYFEKTGVEGVYPAMYYSHNLDFLAVSYGMTGQFEKARQAARQLEGHVQSFIDQMPMFEFALTRPTTVLLRFHRWADVLQLPEPGAGFPVSRAFRHYARGVALAATGRVGEAETERQALRAAVQALPADAIFGLNGAGSVLGVAAAVLDASIAQAKGDHAGAIAAYEEAVRLQDALSYDEPPDWYYPVRESLGSALLADGQAAAAEAVFRADLERTPRNGRSLFGLLQSLKRQGKDDEALLVQTLFDRAWKDADTTLDAQAL